MRFFIFIKQLLALRKVKQKRKNSKKARELANLLFPGEKWIKIEERIYLSPRRAIGKKTNYKNELKDAQILRDFGSTVYLVPENTRNGISQYDAIVNGMQMEFKNQHGASELTLKDHFLTSRTQAPNVFMNLETSPLSKHEIINAVIAARNSPDYTKKNKYPEGGLLILKIKGHKNMINIDINNLL